MSVYSKTPATMYFQSAIMFRFWFIDLRKSLENLAPITFPKQIVHRIKKVGYTRSVQKVRGLVYQFKRICIIKCNISLFNVQNFMQIAFLVSEIHYVKLMWGKHHRSH